MGLIDYWKQQNQLRKEMDQLKLNFYNLVDLMECDPAHLTKLQTLIIYPFCFTDNQKNTAFLFENAICEIETYILGTFWVYLYTYCEIKNRVGNKERFAKEYKSYCALILSKRYNKPYDCIMELLEKRYKFYLTYTSKLEMHFKQIILLSQEADSFIDYNRNYPAVIIDAMQDFRLQAIIKGYLEGVLEASQAQIHTLTDSYNRYW